MMCIGKARFSHKGAWIALHRLSVEKPTGQHAISLYRCPQCKKYHLTKFPPATDLAVEWRKITAEEGAR